MLENQEVQEKKTGGHRPGAGNKAGSRRVEERKKGYMIQLHPSVAEPYRKKIGIRWNQRVENLMREDLQNLVQHPETDPF